MTTSSAVNARAAARAESRMLIDGELREAASGARFDNLSPATGKVLGSTAAASAHDMDGGDRRRAAGVRRHRLEVQPGVAQALPAATPGGARA